MSDDNATPVRGRLGDTPERDYSAKLRLFNAYAEPELRQAIASLQLTPGMRVLDIGCGTGEALGWLANAVGADGSVVGVDLARAHVVTARTRAPTSVHVLQADLMRAPFRAATFDLVWAANTINHLREPAVGVRQLLALLRPEGRIAIAQSSLLPDMYFAWDARLERVTNEAVREYYRQRYGVSERELTSVRSLLGLVREAGLKHVTVQTLVLERTFPLSAAAESYYREAIFRDTFGVRLRPYLSESDYDQLARSCDPGDPRYALRRPDLHLLQTFTLAIGQLSAS